MLLWLPEFIPPELFFPFAPCLTRAGHAPFIYRPFVSAFLAAGSPVRNHRFGIDLNKPFGLDQPLHDEARRTRIHALRRRSRSRRPARLDRGQSTAIAIARPCAGPRPAARGQPDP